MPEPVFATVSGLLITLLFVLLVVVLVLAVARRL